MKGIRHGDAAAAVARDVLALIYNEDGDAAAVSFNAGTHLPLLHPSPLLRLRRLVVRGFVGFFDGDVDFVGFFDCDVGVFDCDVGFVGFFDCDVGFVGFFDCDVGVFDGDVDFVGFFDCDVGFVGFFDCDVGGLRR